MLKILFLPDTRHYLPHLIKPLQAEQWQVHIAFHSDRVRQLLSGEHYDLWLLYSSHSDPAQLEVLSQYPNHPPVVVINKQVDTTFRMRSWLAGSADYLEWPFSGNELLFRLHKQLKLGESTTLQLGESHYDYHQGKISSGSSITWLSKLENRLLSQLARHRHGFVGRQTLLDAVWPVGIFASEDALDVLIRRLRLKLRATNQEIINRRGFGYQLVTKN